MQHRMRELWTTRRITGTSLYRTCPAKLRGSQHASVPSAVSDTFLQELIMYEKDKKRKAALDTVPTPEPKESAFVYTVEADIEELADSYHLYIDAPGIQKSSARVQVHPEKRIVEITWARSRVVPTAKDGFPQAVFRGKYERKMGEFRRTVMLARDCDPSTVSAQLENGVLHLIAKKKLPNRYIPVSGT